MKKPEMILFDYGQTLMDEKFDGVRGTGEVLKYATENKYNLTAEQVQAEAEKINRELGRLDPGKRHLFQVEVPNHMFTAYLYESLGIKINLSAEEIDTIFWNAAAPAKPTEGIGEFLGFLEQKGIRAGVISNIAFAGKVVEKRIRDGFPGYPFEFILASSEYIFRKPNQRIFRLALEKAGLEPDDVWYIGDQYECDVVGARNAGIYPVWYTGAMDMPYEEKEDVRTVSSWKELMEDLRG